MKNLRQLLAQEGLVKTAGLSATAWDYRTHLGVSIDVQRVTDQEVNDEGRWQNMDLHTSLAVVIKTTPDRKEHEVTLWSGNAVITIESMSGEWDKDTDINGVKAGTPLPFLEDLIGMWLSELPKGAIQGLWDRNYRP